MSANLPHLSETELARLAELADRLRDNSIADEEIAELETMLAESAAAREAFAGLAMLTVELRHARGRLTLPAPPVPSARIIPLFHRWRRPLALAAGLVFLAVLSWLFYPRWSYERGAVVARVSDISGAVLRAGGWAISVQNGAPLRTGQHELRAGFLEITYTNGAVVLIESPARFELRGPGGVWLQEGRLSARVPGSATGFTVATPSARVVDLGTEFGVSTGAKGTEVHVFRGEVLVKTDGEPDPLRVKENHASRIDQATHTPTGIEFQPNEFLRSLLEPSGGYVGQVRQLEPVVYYPMRPMPDATLLKDIIGGARHITHDGLVVAGRSSTPWAAGKRGAALRLGGVESGTYARVTDFPLATNNALSVCGWVLAQSRPRWASIAKNWAKDTGKDFGGQFHFGLLHDLGNLEVHVHDRARQEIYALDVAPLPLNEWQFVAFTLDGETLRLYRNGELVASTPCAGLSTFAPAALGIGVKLDETGLRPEHNTPGFWDGLIDELAVFHVALSERQIESLYEASLHASIVPETADHALWHLHGLPPGEHTVRLVTTGQDHPHSKGQRVLIGEAVVYQTK